MMIDRGIPGSCSLCSKNSSMHGRDCKPHKYISFINCSPFNLPLTENSKNACGHHSEVTQPGGKYDYDIEVRMKRDSGLTDCI